MAGRVDEEVTIATACADRWVAALLAVGHICTAAAATRPPDVQEVAPVALQTGIAGRTHTAVAH